MCDKPDEHRLASDGNGAGNFDARLGIRLVLGGLMQVMRIVLESFWQIKCERSINHIGRWRSESGKLDLRVWFTDRSRNRGVD